MSLKPYQQRVVDEKTELDVKLGALDNFIRDGKQFGLLADGEQEDLRLQLGFMRAYSSVLQARISRFI